mmetsp:Transcript_4037/g.12129  ORF Transcript_4037/g.12129 Transcript_4037/m.12129 type:complete len:630 (+) Transcript_4037:66-1955(+)
MSEELCCFVGPAGNGIAPCKSASAGKCAVRPRTLVVQSVLSEKSELRSAPNPPPIYYDFDPENVEAVKIRHVLVESEELADEVISLVKAGKVQLAELARSLSTCEKTKGSGGDLGWHYKDINVTLEPEVEETVFRIRPNNLVKVQSKLGWHVLVVEDAKHRIRVNLTQRGPVVLKTQLPKNQRSEVVEMEKDTYCVQTMGCQMNQADSERMAGELQAAGLREIEDPFRANVVVFNTCSIRDHAEQKVYSYVGRHAKRKWLNPEVTIVVAGCVAQQEGEQLLRRIPEVDIVMGPQYANRLGELMDSVRQGNQVCATDPVHIMEDISKPKRKSTVTAWVNIIYGCNERCTYCVVPGVRGLEQSRPREAIKAEIEELASQGVKEVVLLGQNIDAYGRDLRPRDSLADLLHYVHDVDGIERIRFTTSHPRYMSERLIRTCAELPKLCEYFHVPFQSGDDTVLREMKRGYTAKRFKEIVQKIRSYMPDAAVSADAIVGFPGETEEQFQHTLDLMEEIEFDTVHTAAYSPRPNTPAAIWNNQLSEEVKQDRLSRINVQTAKDAHERSQRYLGRVEEILVEEANSKEPSQVLGRTRTNRLTFFDGNIEELRGKLVRVKITQARTFSLTGELVEVVT